MTTSQQDPQTLGELSEDECALIQALREGRRADAYHPFFRLSDYRDQQWTEETAIAFHILGRLAEEDFLSDSVLGENLSLAILVVSNTISDGLAGCDIQGSLKQIRHWIDAGQTYDRIQRKAAQGGDDE